MKVTLVHGVLLNALFLRGMGHFVRKAGSIPIYFGYPSRSECVEENVQRLVEFVRNNCEPPYCLVGHSYGGLISVQAASFLGAQGRIVTLGSPFQGSLTAQRVCSCALGRMLLKKSQSALLDASTMTLPAGWELGTVAGTYALGVGKLFGAALTQPNDGVVTLEEAQSPLQKDTITVKVSHTAMLWSAAAMNQALHFLKYGNFDHSTHSNA